MFYAALLNADNPLQHLKDLLSIFDIQMSSSHHPECLQSNLHRTWCWSLSLDPLVLTDLLKAVANTLDRYINYTAGRVINTSQSTDTLQSAGYYLSFHPSLSERSNSWRRTGGMMWKPLKSEKETGLGRENGVYHAGCKRMFQECGLNMLMVSKE